MQSNKCNYFFAKNNNIVKSAILAVIYDFKTRGIFSGKDFKLYSSLAGLLKKQM
jgi:hypothetical protein